jgi:hypothetical protein
MGMMLEVLPPDMEHAEKPYVRAEALGVAGKFEQRSGAGAEEQIIEQTLPGPRVALAPGTVPVAA